MKFPSLNKKTGLAFVAALAILTTIGCGGRSSVLVRAFLDGFELVEIGRALGDRAECFTVEIGRGGQPELINRIGHEQHISQGKKADREEHTDRCHGHGVHELPDPGTSLLEALKELMAHDPQAMEDAEEHEVDQTGPGAEAGEHGASVFQRLLDTADVVIHDRLVPQEILELARREAILVDAGKQGFGPAMTQEEINTLIVRHAQDGHHVVRLKSGDPGVFGRLDEELDACDAAGIEWQIVPGLTSAAAAAAGIGQGLTRRGRNSAVRLLTGHDVKGFAEHDWRALARPGEVAALYMAKRGARFLQGRLLMHGAAPETPVTIVENASRPDEQVIATTLAALPATLESGDVAGPAILLYGLAPRARATAAAPAPARSETTLKEFA